MNVFDTYTQALGRQDPYAGTGLTQNHPQGGSFMSDGDEDPMPTPPFDLSKLPDMSGFLDAGMSSAPLQDPMAQLKNLMSMAPQQRAPQPVQKGNLMNYLASLGAV